MEVAGKVCLITGGTKGIGAATAIEFARRGAHVAINGRTADEEALSVKARIDAMGCTCLIVAADMAEPAEAAGCVQQTATTLGGLDVLVHSAGGAAPGSLMEVSEESWYRAFDVHVHALFHLCRAAAPFMKRNSGGAIILVSSAAGLRGCLGVAAYGVVKGALPQFARLLARELADDNIRVNCVSPGVIRTRFHDSLSAEQVKNNIDSRIPLHREGTPDDVAKAIAMLVCNEFITGENIVLDGGMTMRIV